MVPPIIINYRVEPPPENTNYPPPDAQKREISASISAEEEELGALEAEVSRIQSSLDRLRWRLLAKKGRVGKLKEPIAPLKDLPNEIISRIFEHHPSAPPPNYDPRAVRPPWYLGQICSACRRVALAIPSLWDFIVVEVDDYTAGDQRSFDAARELLTRIGESPFSCVFFRTKSASLSVQHVFQLLSYHVRRLWSLKIEGIDGIASLAELPDVAFTCLETLELACYAIDDI